MGQLRVPAPTKEKMERPKTQAEIRRDRFNEAGALAKAIGDVALEDIDAALETNAQHSELFYVWMSDEKAHFLKSIITETTE